MLSLNPHHMEIEDDIAIISYNYYFSYRNTINKYMTHILRSVLMLQLTLLSRFDNTRKTIATRFVSGESLFYYCAENEMVLRGLTLL